MQWITEIGQKIDGSRTQYPTIAGIVGVGSHKIGMPSSTTFVVVHRGEAALANGSGGQITLTSGAYASVVDERTVKVGSSGRLFHITRHGYRGQQIIGSVEKRGRLSYIDGCSDTMLVYPPRLGDPVLNHLHFPGGVLQSQHTHPTIRVGVVLRGEGFSWRGVHGAKDDLRLYLQQADAEGLESAVRQWRDDFDAGESNVDMLHHLREGGMFFLEEQELHSFATVKSQAMDIVAYHPDSDWGPTDHDHPMLNRTYLAK